MPELHGKAKEKEMSLIVQIEKKLAHTTLQVYFSSSETDGVLGILGASGCGKSMTLKCIAGIETPDCGKIILNDRVLYDSEKKINVRVQDRRVGYLFQSYALFPNMTAFENVLAAVHYSALHRGIKISRSKEEETALSYMEMLDMEQVRKQYPAQLSGGQQQRVALARILASKPEVLMLDEPFSAVDAYLKEQLQLELTKLLKEYGKDVLMVTHSRDEIYRFCDRMLILKDGKQCGYGSTKEIFKRPETVAAARLTGCKNIVKGERLDAHRIYLSGWNTLLDVKGEIPEGTSYIGIRAHFLKPENPDAIVRTEDGKTVNAVCCMTPRILEDPFECVAVFEGNVWWKVAKEILSGQYKNKLPEYLSIPESSLLYLHE